MSKKCDKGKSCGGSCVSASYKCQVDFDSKVTAVLKSLRDSVQGKSRPDDELSAKYEEAFGEENRIGSGAFGAVYAVGDDAIKVGEIEESEVEMSVLAGELGVGPQIKEFSPYPSHSSEDEGAISMVVMERVKGDTLDRFFGQVNSDAIRTETGVPTVHPDSEEVGRVMDSLISQRSKMHKAGMLHGDCHSQNVIYDKESGKATIIDWGFGELRGGRQDDRFGREVSNVIPDILKDPMGSYGKSPEKLIRMAEVMSDKAILRIDGNFTIYTGLYGFRQAYDNSPNYRKLVNNFIKVNYQDGHWSEEKTRQVYEGID